MLTVSFQVGIFLVTVLQLCKTASSSPYDLQVGLDGVLNSSNVTVRSNLIGETIRLVCSTNGCLVDAKLEWLDGRVPIRHPWLGNRALERNESSTLTLHIYNFTVENYGQYRCRCVKDYSQPPLLSPTEHASSDDAINLKDNPRLADHTVSFCSDREYFINLLPENGLGRRDNLMKEYFVNESAKTIQLECLSGKWTIWKTNSVPESISGGMHNITVDKSSDQAKITCLNENETLYKIFYVSIEGYHQLPLGFNRPMNNGDVIVSDTAFFSTPLLCMGQPSLGLYDAEISLVVNGTRYSGQKLDNQDLSVQILHDVILKSIIIYSGSNIGEIYRYSNFSCVASSYWEPTIEVSFRIIESGSMVQPSTSHPSRSCTASSTTLPSSSSQTLTLLPLPSPSRDHTPHSLPLPPRDRTSHPPLHSTPPHSLPSPSPEHTSQHHTKHPEVTSVDRRLTTTTSIPVVKNGEDKANTIIFVTVGVSLLFIIGIVLLLIGYVWLRKKKNRTLNKQSNSIITELLERNGGWGEISPLNMDNRSLLSKQLAHCKRELEESQWFFPYEQLELGEDLGSGAFGRVKKATALDIESKQSSLTVAVKMLKDIQSDEDEKDLISELKLLQHVGAHPNIVSLMGACVHQGSLYVIVEFCGKGNLLHYLRSKRNDRHDFLTSKHLVAMASQVALGMDYLTSKKCIHRDLAARNVLVSDDLVLKVADFGLARKLYDSVYRPSGGRVPIKWMSPETILDREYTAQSDVWSFGVLLWEIMTLGRTPYPEKSPEEVIKCIGEGYRMSSPDHCPDEIYSVMLMCWDQLPHARPTFSGLVHTTEELKESLEATEIQNHYGLEGMMSLLPTGSELCSDCAAEDGYISQADGEDQCSILQADDEDQCSYCVSYKEECHCYVNTNMHNEETPKEPTKSDQETNGQLRVKDLESDETLPPMESNPSRSQKLSIRRNQALTSFVPVLYSSNDYLPIVQAHSLSHSGSSNDYLPIIQALSDSGSLNSSYVQSMTLCSICKNSHWESSNRYSNSLQSHDQSLSTSSLGSICSDCKGEMLKDSSNNMSINNYYDHLLSSSLSPQQDDDLHWIYPDPTQQSTRPILPVHKLKIEYQNSNMSNDSGVMTMTSDTTFNFFLQKNSESEEAVSDAEEMIVVSGDEEYKINTRIQSPSSCRENPPEEGSSFMTTHVSAVTSSSTHHRSLSAHPSNRAFFEQLGITESDV